MWKTLGTILVCAVGAVALLLVGLLAYLTITEYDPPEEEALAKEGGAEAALAPGASFTALSFNIGYGALGEESDFFMDGGASVMPPSAEIVEKNLTGILEILDASGADIFLLQEVDRNSKRSYGTDQPERLRHGRKADAALALNYSCNYVPYPLPTIGRVNSGLYTMSSYAFAAEGGATRLSLPCPFGWPLRIANLKRCLLNARLPIEGTDKELVLVNLHLEAYDSGEGKEAQTARLMNVLQAEYDKGNYVVAGGDFNCTFPVVDPAAWPLLEEGNYVPGVIPADALPPGFQWAVDPSAPTCRLLNKPLGAPGENQLYVIDGFILSPNVKLESVQTLDEGFTYSDHNPVLLKARLLP